MKLPVIHIFYGRFNPITTGHITSMKSIFSYFNLLTNQKILILISSKMDINNPLSFKQRKKIFNYLLPNIEVQKLNGSLDKKLIKLYKDYNKINLYVGEDRLHKFLSLSYSLNKLYNVNMMVFSTGERIEGISGTSLRNSIKVNDINNIRSNLLGLFPSKFEENKYIKMISKAMDKHNNDKLR